MAPGDDAAIGNADARAGDTGGGDGDGGGSMQGRDAMASDTGSMGMPMGDCPAPAGVSANASAALELLNATRAAMGAPCATMVPTINTAAERHCAYYASNRSMSRCVANPHGEVSDCPMFVAESFANRMRMAGYTGSPAMEDMHFLNNGAGAVQGWIDSVYHRTPVLNPWIRDVGYGSAMGCDTMDFGSGAAAPANLTVSYPYANQTNVPVSFGGNEGPTPPVPPTGWPSGYPITLFVRGGMLTTHSIVVDGTSEELAHVWAPAGGLLRDANVLYTHRPLTAHTRYRVRAEGMNAGGPVRFDFVFTTR